MSETESAIETFSPPNGGMLSRNEDLEFSDFSDEETQARLDLLRKKMLTHKEHDERKAKKMLRMETLLMLYSQFDNKRMKEHTVKELEVEMATSAGRQPSKRVFFYPTPNAADDLDFVDLPATLSPAKRTRTMSPFVSLEEGIIPKMSYVAKKDASGDICSKASSGPCNSFKARPKLPKAKFTSKEASLPKSVKSLKQKKGCWRQRKNIPNWMSSSDNDSDRDESEESEEKSARRRKFTDQEIEALYSAAHPYKYDLQHNFKNISSDQYREKRQRACIKVIAEAINTVNFKIHEESRHRWRIWFKIHDLRHCTKRKVESIAQWVREHKLCTKSGAEVGPMPRLSRTEQICYEFYEKDFILGIDGSKEYGADLEGIPLSLAERRANHESEEALVKQSIKTQQKQRCESSPQLKKLSDDKSEEILQTVEDAVYEMVESPTMTGMTGTSAKWAPCVGTEEEMMGTERSTPVASNTQAQLSPRKSVIENIEIDDSCSCTVNKQMAEDVDMLTQKVDELQKHLDFCASELVQARIELKVSRQDLAKVERLADHTNGNVEKLLEAVAFIPQQFVSLHNALSDITTIVSSVEQRKPTVECGTITKLAKCDVVRPVSAVNLQREFSVDSAVASNHSDMTAEAGAVKEIVDPLIVPNLLVPDSEIITNFHNGNVIGGGPIPDIKHLESISKKAAIDIVTHLVDLTVQEDEASHHLYETTLVLETAVKNEQCLDEPGSPILATDSLASNRPDSPEHSIQQRKPTTPN